MNATGIPDLTQTAAELSQANARIAAIATEACADCERMRKRIDELENALRQVTNNYADLREAFMPARHDTANSPLIVRARAILAKGN